MTADRPLQRRSGRLRQRFKSHRIECLEDRRRLALTAGDLLFGDNDFDSILHFDAARPRIETFADSGAGGSGDPNFGPDGKFASQGTR